MLQRAPKFFRVPQSLQNAPIAPEYSKVLQNARKCPKVLQSVPQGYTMRATEYLKVLQSAAKLLKCPFREHQRAPEDTEYFRVL